MRVISVFVCMAAVCALAAPGEEYTFGLQWQKDCIRSRDQVMFNHNETFASEPNSTGRDVRRAVLNIGPDKATEVGLLWDEFEGKLYVDLNRDGRLGDDPNETFAAAERGYFQRFTGILLSFEDDSGVHRYQLEFECNSRYTYGHVFSGFSGSCNLNGRTWTIQVNDALKGSVGRGDLFSVSAEQFNNRISSGNIPQSVFLDGRLYDIKFDFRKENAGFAALWCTLEERQAPVGTLQIKGQWIEQLVLGDGRMLVLSELSDQPVTVPAGELKIKQFALKFAPDKPAVSVDRLNKTVSIAEGVQSELVIGGPLKSTVDISRRGTILYFSYGLVGSGGERYNVGQLTGYDRSKPPTVAVYKGDTRLASGKFEYG